ncbi:hypothetical protein UVI_02041160 [Ustilaginoidea virens]|nr:hypothetical protein UVI_02041160 [Ustilaginoidea virens]
MILSGSRLDHSPGPGPASSTDTTSAEPLHQIVQSFVPHISVYASDDTESLISAKGFQHGLWELLRPFGERIPRKVTIRDSNGLSHTTDDFAVRFTRFGENPKPHDVSASSSRQSCATDDPGGVGDGSSSERSTLVEVDSLVERHLAFAETALPKTSLHLPDALMQGLDTEHPSPYYSLYLRRLLYQTTVAPQETFAHPVACVIAISSRSDNPIEELRKLYAETTQANKHFPPWVDNDYLRYYVLVHDDENDDITRSMGFFEQMKRHLGFHCHLLRLRCSKSAETDDDSVPLPDSDWISAGEELARIDKSERDEDLETPPQHIFESDATAIRTFVREMVTQSIVPTMERHVSVWNDQVASRRRGIAGRFMNLSRKWTGFGSSSRTSPGNHANTRDALDSLGHYHACSAEAIMRKLADYAFMLRDWKLAHSTYDLLRSDFSESKAWKYHAGASEMAAVSLLLASRAPASRLRAEPIDQMLEAAFYSYSSRCSAPLGAARCLLLGLELLRLRGGPDVDDAGGWGSRLHDSRILGPVGEALLKERLCVCYLSKRGSGGWGWGGRSRKAAFWSLLAAEAWWRQAKYIPAQRCLEATRRIYENLPRSNGIVRFQVAQEHVKSLQLELVKKLSSHHMASAKVQDDEEGAGTDVESQSFATLPSRRRSVTAGITALTTAPLGGESLGGNDASASQQALEFE